MDTNTEHKVNDKARESLALAFKLVTMAAKIVAGATELLRGTSFTSPAEIHELESIASRLTSCAADLE